MKSFTFATTTALFASAVSAQYAIDPNSVANSTRQAWCGQQQSQCPLICLQTAADSATTESNSCDWQTLTYSCVCSNGISPNVSEYSQTLPYYICQEWGNQCVANCDGNSQCQSDCRDNHPCGALNPTRQNTSTLTSTMTSSSSVSGTGTGSAPVTTDASGATIYSGFGDQPASSTGAGGSSGGGEHSGASALVRVWSLSAGQTFGTLALVGAFIGGFAVLL